MRPARTYTLHKQNSNQNHTPLKTQNTIKTDEKSVFSRNRSHLTKELIEEYSQKSSLDLKNENDFEIILKLLKKANKKTADIEIILKAFDNISFFQDLKTKIPPEHINQLIKHFTYENKERGEIVFKYDDYGTNYYILLNGSVYVLVPKATLNADYTPEKQYVAAQYLTEPNITITNVNKQIKPKENKSINDETNNIKNDETMKCMIEIKNKDEPIISFELNTSHVSPSQKKKFMERVSVFQEGSPKRGQGSIVKKKTVFSKEKEEETLINIKKTFPDFEIIKKLESVIGFGEIALLSNNKRFFDI